MNKKTPYEAYYYSLVRELTQPQLKAIKSLPEVDISAIQQRMDMQNIYGIVCGKSDYPRRLMQFPQAPYIIYYQGSIEVLHKPVLAIVGPRVMSNNAQQILEKFFSYIQHFDIVTVSGMAQGVDTLCHQLSIKYNIPTIAVLGGGFAKFLRGSQRNLMAEIVSHGGVILSQYKHSQPCTNRTFPQRNRIIAGIADVVFLPEASHNSGSLITADIGYKMATPVVAPMNSIFLESAKGTNLYIASGKIKPLHDLKDFLHSYFPVSYKKLTDESVLKNISGHSHEEEKIISSFQNETSLTTHQLSEKTGYDLSELLMYVSMLEIKGVIYEISPGVYEMKHTI